LYHDSYTKARDSSHQEVPLHQQNKNRTRTVNYLVHKLQKDRELYKKGQATWIRTSYLFDG
jgi:hypothetical protein